MFNNDFILDAICDEMNDLEQDLNLIHTNYINTLMEAKK